MAWNDDPPGARNKDNGKAHCKLKQYGKLSR